MQLGASKYFFAHDQLNYARHSPLYLANMVQSQSDDKQSWDYLKHNYTVSKSTIPFTSIGSDHAMEQDNKKIRRNNRNNSKYGCLTLFLLDGTPSEFNFRNILYKIPNHSSRCKKSTLST